MSRTAVVAVVMLNLGGPVAPVRTAAQSTAPVSWSYDLDAYTIYGHTTYRERLVLLPRVVYDTARTTDSARVVDSVRATVLVPTGLAAGLSQWPTDRLCAGPTSATVLTLEPAGLLDRVRAAARCAVRLVIVPPRRFLTTNGLTEGPFSVDSAKHLIDRYAAVLPPDTLRKYGRTILGLNLGDDYGCASCWGGKTVTQVQVAAWAAYARTRLPALPLGVRVTPDWVQAYPALAPLIDYAWAQYHTRKGDAQAFFDSAAAGAARVGLGIVMGINAEDCAGTGTPPCTADELVKYGTIAVTHPASCAFLSWRYVEATWESTEVRAAWDRLLAAARGRAGRECRRA
jgi:hypothetical protein